MKIKSEFILNHIHNNLQQQNMIVSNLENNQISHTFVMRNKDVYKNNFNKLLTRKDKKKYYNVLKRRIKLECLNVFV